MTSSAEQMRHYKGPALFSFGFRPFFLGGSIIAAVVPLVTALVLGGALKLPMAADIVVWHSHEMVYGYLGAVAAGFILTAVPNWTGRLPMMGVRLGFLAGLWLAGRIAMLASDMLAPNMLGSVAVALIDASFLFLLDIFLWREVITGKNWRNAPVCMLILLLATGNAVWHYQTLNGGDALFGLHAGIGVMAVLLSLIGGRVTPSFTRNWLAKSDREASIAPFAMLDKIAIGTLVVGVVLWLFLPQNAVTGFALLVAGALHFIRLARWRGWRCASEPLVLILHIGYFWLALAMTLLGVSVLAPASLPATAALHALTAGAMGVMTLAVMSRATLGHTGRALSADAPTLVIYILVNLGAALRVGAPLLPMPYGTAITLSSLVWSGAFALFAVIYGRYLLTPKSPAD